MQHSSDNGSGSDSDSSSGLGKTAWEGKNSAWLTAGIIVADVVGAGILGMPNAVKHFGWALGTIVLTLMLAANVHISLLLWRVKMFCPGCYSAITYVDLCRGAFVKSSKLQRRSIAIVTGISQYSFLFGLMGIYLLSAGKGLGMLFYNTHICLPIWALIASAVLLPFAGTAREMGTYQSLVWINIITLCGTVLIPLGYYCVHGTEGIKPEDSQVLAFAPLTAAGVLSALSTFTFGMTSQFMLTEIIAEMKDPAELPKAYVSISAPFQLIAFMVAGLGGYFFLGDAVNGMINENLPFGIAFQVGAFCLVTHMLISYLIKGVVLCRAMLTAAKEEWASPDDPRKRALFGWNVMVIPTIIAAWLLANLVPFFNELVDLLGASFTPLSCWVIPILMFIRYYVDAEEKPKVSIFEWIAIALEMCLAVVLLFLGTYTSLVAIHENWQSFGYPFECHCEGIWETCACSSHHIGMMDQCAAPGPFP
mmetsp:Transcript_99359/g.206967  ORF Transcript_99359/g.206967 Transcript_99359/m.206967 type:complete len:478 (+) Transcript_99359:192-1625(+)